MRAISTVLDASLCLLLVSASALTLAGTPLASESNATVGPDTADETAELLATSTALVTYDAGNRTRTAHDTLAGLLASAAVADARPASHPEFVRAVTARVGRAVRSRAVRRSAVRRSAVQRPAVRVQVVARANTYRDAPETNRDAPETNRDAPETNRDAPETNSARGGRIVAGDAPPPDADVHAATFAVRRVVLTVRTWSR